MSPLVFREPKILIQKAKRKPVTTAYGRTLRLSKQMGNAVGIDLFKGVTRFKKRISLESVRSAWENGDYSKIITHVPWDKLPEDLNDFAKGMRRSIGKAAELSGSSLPPNINARLRFDATNPAIDRYLNKRVGSIVVGIQSDTRDVIQQAVQRSFTQALTPRDVADQIKDSIGLHPQYETALRNYEAGLKEQGLPQRSIDKLTSQYEDRLLDARAMTIGRTEIRNATNYGQLSMWKEAANKDLIDRRTSKKVWVVDNNPCEDCAPMDGEAVALDEPWIMDDGTVCQVPSDAHPNCYCGMELEFQDEADQVEQAMEAQDDSDDV